MSPEKRQLEIVKLLLDGKTLERAELIVSLMEVIRSAQAELAAAGVTETPAPASEEAETSAPR